MLEKWPWIPHSDPWIPGIVGPGCSTWCSRIWFRWFQMAQAIVANKFGFLACMSTHAVSCLKSWNWVWLLKSQSSESAQTTSSSVQVQKACRGSSGAKEHRSHVGFEMMVRRTRFFFDGKVFLQALQMKFLSLIGVCNAQTPFHRSLSWS